MDTARSVNGSRIRLSPERWIHISEEHSELAGRYFEVLEAVENPERVLEGAAGEYLAVREAEPGKHLVVVYKEVSLEDGFIITAFLTRRARSLERRRQAWPK